MNVELFHCEGESYEVVEQKFYKIFYCHNGKLLSSVSGCYYKELADPLWKVLHTYYGLEYQVGIETQPKKGVLYGFDFNNFQSAKRMANAEAQGLHTWYATGNYVVYECEGKVIQRFFPRITFSSMATSKEFFDAFWDCYLSGDWRAMEEHIPADHHLANRENFASEEHRLSAIKTWLKSATNPEAIGVLSCTPIKKIYEPSNEEREDEGNSEIL